MNLFISLIYNCFKWMPLACVRCLGWLIGVSIWVCNTRVVKITRKNIAMCWPTLNAQQQAQLTRAATIEMAITALELLKVWATDPNKLKTCLVEMRNKALYKDALAAKKAVILVVPHLGNWEVMGLFAAQQAPMTSMYAPIKYEAIDDLVKRSREASGSTLVPASVRGVMSMLKALKRGEQIGILPDQKADKGSGLHSPFFGTAAYTMTLINTLQSKSNATVIMAFAERVRGGWCLHFMAPDADVYSSDLQTAVDGLNRSVENCVRQCPAQYQWEYKRFSGQPDGSNPYEGI